MFYRIAVLTAFVFFSSSVRASELRDAVQDDYDDHLSVLFEHFHRAVPERFVAVSDARDIDRREHLHLVVVADRIRVPADSLIV